MAITNNPEKLNIHVMPNAVHENFIENDKIIENELYLVETDSDVVTIEEGGTGAKTPAQARVNLGIETEGGTVYSSNADYAEVGEWSDGNPNNEDRIGYFVCIDDTEMGINIRKATSRDDIRGVTVLNPAFTGNRTPDKCDENGNLLKQFTYVGVIGIVTVVDNGRCTINGRCMPSDTGDGTAVPSTNKYGYHVLERYDENHIIIAIEPGADMNQRIRADLSAHMSDYDQFKNTTNESILELQESESIYVQNEEPEDAPEGSVWIDLDDPGFDSTDDTLSLAGIPADARAVGEAIANIEVDVYASEDSIDASADIINADTLGGHPSTDFATTGDINNINHRLGEGTVSKQISDAVSGLASESFVTNKIAEAQLSGGGSGDIDLSGYATKDDLNNINNTLKNKSDSNHTHDNYATKDDLNDVSNKVGDSPVSTQITNAINEIDYPVDSVNGKTGAVQLSASDVGALSTSGGTLTGNAYINFNASDAGFSWNCDGEQYVLRPLTGTGLQLLSNNGSGYVPALRLAPDGKMELGNSKIIDSLNVGDKLNFHTDGEGGNITIFPPAGTGVQSWDIDAHDGNIRFYNFADDGTYNEPLKLYKDGSIGSSNAAKTREHLGAAPSGYGLGTEYARGLNSTSDLNSITQNGWYSWKYNSVPKNAPTDDNLFLDNMFVMGSGASCIQLVFDTQPRTPTGTIVKRINYGGTQFSEWEYINPPMLAGVSYRTTERYMGRPVFMIAVNLGSTPAAGATKDIPHGIPGVETVIDYWGTYADQQAIFNNDNIDTILVTPTTVRVKMSSIAGNGAYNLSMVFKYIKNGI